MKIILASKSGVRKEILDTYKIDCDVIVSNVDEDEVKNSLLGEGADPLQLSKNLFKKNNWPIIDVTRKSVEETAASILKIIEIKKNK